MNAAQGQTRLQELRKLIQTKEDDLAKWRAVFEALAARETGLCSKLDLAGRSNKTVM